jgi:hypothetical protein
LLQLTLPTTVSRLVAFSASRMAARSIGSAERFSVSTMISHMAWL